VRNSIVAVTIAMVAAQGQLDVLTILPLTLIGPFFFLGLRFHTALLSGAVTVLSFTISAAAFDLELPIALRASGFLVMSFVACAIAARHLEHRSRIAFLETRLIAELAEHDALTGTKNRRIFDEHLLRLWRQGIEDRCTIAVLLIDIDHFKAYNDRYGHQAGDHALRRVAQHMQTFVRRPLDILARYGGEEFAAVLYGVNVEQAVKVAGRIRSAVEALNIEHTGSRTSSAVTISAGVAVVQPTPERNPLGALQLADQALYEAKLRGRNKIEVMSEEDYRALETGSFTQAAVS
jgi:diguanylate cyclase (GGDEF)-like protein